MSIYLKASDTKEGYEHWIFMPKDGSGSPISTGYDIEQAKAL